MQKLLFLFVCLWSALQAHVVLEECQDRELPECERIFIQAFMIAYQNFSNEELGVADKEQFLKAAFQDVYEDKREGLQKIVVAKQDGVILGFVGYKQTDKPHQIYISQLAVDPDHWHQGIGRHLVFGALTSYPETTSLCVIPRRINAVARAFYLKNGFIETDYMHPGYNPLRYVGYEWYK